MKTKEIRLLYFAQLRGARGVTEERYFTGAENPRELYGELARQYGFTLSFDQLRVAIDHAIVGSEETFADGDTVAFLPPVSGG